MLIPLTRGEHARIDDQDWPLVQGRRWQCHVDETGLKYATARGGIIMHRTILGLTKGDPDVDHIDRDGLNNTRENLRLAPGNGNHANRKPRTGGSSRFKGVGWYKPRNQWRARICVNYKLIHLGYFDSEEQAAIAYDVAARSAFGEFARPNF